MSPIRHVPRDGEFKTYFMTLTVIEWIDIFTKPAYFNILADSLKYCMENKGLVLYEYVFMTNHVHLIAKCREGCTGLSTVLRDFKQFTTRQISQELERDSRGYIKRLLDHSFSKKHLLANQIWQPANYPKVIEREHFRNQKVQYIWQNPVKKGYVEEPQDWKYSSARQRLVGVNGELPLVCAEWEG